MPFRRGTRCHRCARYTNRRGLRCRVRGRHGASRYSSQTDLAPVVGAAQKHRKSSFAPATLAQVPRPKRARMDLDAQAVTGKVSAQAHSIQHTISAMSHDLWFLVSGLWSLVSGLWSLVSGFWSLVSGLWFLVSGLWSLVSGLWSLVSGLWSLVFVCLFCLFLIVFDGFWSLISGFWSLGFVCFCLFLKVSGLWSLVSGLWSLVFVCFCLF